MKKLLLIIHLSIGATMVVFGQQYEKFRVGFGSGFTLANLQEPVADGGILFMCEPAFHLNDNLVIGLRLEFADTQLDILFGGKPIGSFTINGQYFFGTKKFRPMVGAGLGLYSVPSYNSPNNDKKFGFYPRVGFDFRHFFLAMEYNLVQPSESYYLDEIKNNYFGFTIGVFVGGSKKIPSQFIQ